MSHDRQQRQEAVNPNLSCIVQAPAGSGKTALLTRRFLTLLARVDDPSQILAITFTRKAAAEMRDRLLTALEGAGGPAPSDPYGYETWELAKAALQRDRTLQWELLRNPARLQIQTMDSFNGTLVQQMPWMSRMGGMPRITDRPQPLYRQAAAHLLEHIETGGACDPSLRRLLHHLDNRLDRLRDMLALMLGRRDQWLACLPRQGGEETRAQLEGAIRQMTELQLMELSRQVPAALKPEILAVARYAHSQMPATVGSLEALAGCDAFPTGSLSDLTAWVGVSDLLLTATGGWRRRLAKNTGFPAQGAGAREWKERALSLIEGLAAVPGLDQDLDRLRHSAVVGYTEEQWEVLEALLYLLPRAVTALWEIFRTRGEVDFSEMAIRATEALGAEDNPSDLLLQLDRGIHHILVDEFQDTSRLQYRLLRALTAGWTPEDGRTLFLVGDPMQSIYRFREAEVGLFLQAMDGGLGDVPLSPLRLEANFRSQEKLVAWCNRVFAEVLPPQSQALTGAVAHAPSTAIQPASAEEVRIFAYGERDEVREAADLCQQVRVLWGSSDDSIGVLVRSRGHLVQIARELNLADIPYQAQEVDPLERRPVVMDLLALTRALFHPADRVHWLAVLRAPWCGLHLTDLQKLTDLVGEGTVPSTLDTGPDLSGLTAEGQRRLTEATAILLAFERQKGRLPLRKLVENCWLALGGPSCYPSRTLVDAGEFFRLLEKQDEAGEPASFELLTQEVETLFAAPDPTASSRIQLMTVHKAKGLEFDHVLLPGLGKTIQEGESPLLRWIYDPSIDLVVAPIRQRNGSEKDPLSEAVAWVERQRGRFETGRLLYVACTRARKALYLFGHARRNARGDLRPAKGSFLACLWPHIAEHWEDVSESVQGEEKGWRPPRLQRLPAETRRPSFPKLPLGSGVQVRTASQRAEVPEEVVFSGYENEMGRLVGTVIHDLLERIAEEGLPAWDSDRLDRLSQEVRFRLMGLGALADSLDRMEARVLEALKNTLSSDTGRWILGSHPEAASEWPLGGVLAGERVHAVIDRTFVDVDGTRVIVDYKTSLTDPGDIDGFLSAELEKYRLQMMTYARLMAALEPERPIRALLYFPLLDRLAEVSVQSPDCCED